MAVRVADGAVTTAEVLATGGVGLGKEAIEQGVKRGGKQVVREGIEEGLEKGGKRAASAEPPQLSRGKRAHREEPALSGEKREVPTPSGKRMDRYNEETGHIREIKPDNPRAIKNGEKQVERYRREMEAETGRPHTAEVTPYDPEKYK